jgi:hypothetical protein
MTRHVRYNHSPKGRARNHRYDVSEKGWARQQRYNLSDKGRARDMRARLQDLARQRELMKPAWDDLERTLRVLWAEVGVDYVPEPFPEPQP